MSRIYEALRRSGSRLADLGQTGAGRRAGHVGAAEAGGEGPMDALADTAGVEGLPADELAQVPVERVKLEESSRIVFRADTDDPGADRFRFLRMRLREYWTMGKLRTLVITSPHPGDGKSTVVLNLATALAEGGKRSVVVVEGDHHRPAIGRALGLEAAPGLAECLADGLDPVAALRRIEPLQWHLLQAGKSERNRTELLQSDALAGVLGRLRRLFDWVLIDTPPVIPLADTLVMARHSDATLLVVRADRTPAEAVEEALTLLGPKQVLGMVLNGAETVNQMYPKYYGYYKPRGGVS